MRDRPAGLTNQDLTTRPPTIYDVAQSAGVSHQTVSRYLRGFPGIRPATQARVESALDALGYQPNLTARSLKSGRSHRIGALTHDLDHVGPSRVAVGASAAARESGYVLDLVALDVRDPEAIQGSLRLLSQHSLAGVLALASTDEMSSAFETARFRVPHHIEWEADEAGEATSGLTGTAIPALISYLTNLGHTRFLHLAGPGNWSAGRNRARAVQRTLASMNLQSAGTLEGDWSARSGYEAMKSLAELPDATAIIAANDQMALGCMLALKECGLRVPDDVTVVGIDDIPEAAYFDPPLTTLKVDFAARGRAAVLEILSRIEGTSSPRDDIPTPQIIVRRSSGPARPGHTF